MTKSASCSSSIMFLSVFLLNLVYVALNLSYLRKNEPPFVLNVLSVIKLVPILNKYEKVPSIDFTMAH